MKKYFLIGVVLLMLSGCVTSIDEQGNETRSVDPNAVNLIETGTETGASVLQLLSPFLGPSAGLISGALITALGIWRKVKPQLMNAENDAEIAYATSGVLVDSIEIFKKSNPVEWAKLESKIVETLEKNRVDTKILENVIRGLRGLPPKG